MTEEERAVREAIRKMLKPTAWDWFALGAILIALGFAIFWFMVQHG